MFLGFAFIFIMILDIFHILTYADLIIYPFESIGIGAKFWIAARTLELSTFLISFILLYYNDLRPNFYLIFAVYTLILIFLIIDILYLNIFIPQMKTYSGITTVKIFWEYILSTGFLLCCFILYKLKKKIDYKLYTMLIMAFIFKAISEIFFTFCSGVTDQFNVLGHIFKIVSYYYLYTGIVVNGLQRPLDMIKYNLNKADTAIQEKERQRLSMEEIINQNEHCYDWIIDNSGNGIAIIIDKQISYANSTAVNILGAKNLDDLKGRKIYDFIGGNSLKSLRFTNQKNNYEHNEIIIKNLNNELINAEFNVNKINYRNKSAQLLIIKDISYRNEIKTLKNELSVSEDQLNKTNEYNKMLTEFFSNISHELKTPINVILSAVQLLICQSEEPADNFNEKLSLLLNVVKQNGYRLIRLVNNLLDISKYDSGYMKLEIHNYNIVNIVEEITLSVAEYIESKGVTLLFDTDTEERIMAVDADKIERIMLNLLSNAVKFTNDGDEITVTIKDNEDYVSVCVKDTGIGIPEDKLKMIFDRFAQIDKTLIRNKEGSGIGLSLVKTLINMHGGNISVNSVVGVGSEFVMELPVRLVEEAEQVNNNCSESKIEKILIEFSDIYG